MHYPLDNSSGKESEYTLTTTIGTLKERSVWILVNGVKVESIDLNAGESKMVKVVFKAKAGKNMLKFKTDKASEFPGNGDQRKLAFSLSTFSLSQNNESIMTN